MELEEVLDIDDPSLGDIIFAVSQMTADGGPAFMILEDDDNDRGDYVQAAGGYSSKLGAARFTVERRTYERDLRQRPIYSRPFRHLVAGYKHQESIGEISIATNGYQVTVQSNEVLTADDVIAIFRAFLDSRSLPDDYRWRSNKDEVEEIVRETASAKQEH